MITAIHIKININVNFDKNGVPIYYHATSKLYKIKSKSIETETMVVA